MLRLIKYLLLFFFIFSGISSFSQTKKDLQKEKEKIQKEISETNKKLNKENSKKNNALKELILSNQKIKQHNYLLTNIQQTINIQNSTISKVEKNIETLNVSIQNKKTELEFSKSVLSKLIYQTYIWKNTYNESFFLISSSNLNQLYKRKQYLNQLTVHRTNQINKINKLTEDLKLEQHLLIVKKATLLDEKINQEQLLLVNKSESKNLQSEKNKNSLIVNKIKQNEQFYRTELANKKIESKAVDDQIKKIIEEEIRKARLEAEKNNNGSPLTPESIELSSNFTSNMGKLPWPLSKGVITEKYGIKKHQAISGVETKNNGINFSTDEGEMVRVVFDGTVSRIFFIKGKGKAILVNHGSYFTVYSGLKDVIVQTGEKVFAKQTLGTIVTSETSGDSELHFEIWKGKETQNPVKWLYKAN
ncbi:MAG: murein hydrolase activator EnvC family protein [Flavobacteriales bacterium]